MMVPQADSPRTGVKNDLELCSANDNSREPKVIQFTVPLGVVACRQSRPQQSAFVALLSDKHA